jgi:hypothetical protein
MKVIVMVKATKNSEAGALPSEESFAEMGKFNEELVKAGIMEAAEGLQPSSEGKRVQFSGAKRTVLNGPFGNTEDLLAGFWIWKVKSMGEALEWAKCCPNPMPGEEAVLELRPLFEAEDFAEKDPTGELRRKEEELRRTMDNKRRQQSAEARTLK